MALIAIKLVSFHFSLAVNIGDDISSLGSRILLLLLITDHLYRVTFPSLCTW